MAIRAKAATAALFSVFLVWGLTACENDSPLEETGDQIEEAGDEIEETADEMEEEY